MFCSLFGVFYLILTLTKVWQKKKRIKNPKDKMSTEDVERQKNRDSKRRKGSDSNMKEMHGIDQFTQAHVALDLPSAIP